MFALKRRHDPAPSKTGFRLRRLWRSRLVRRVATLWAPAALTIGLCAWLFSLEEVRRTAEAQMETWREAMMTRPEFAVTRLDIYGASAAVEAALRAELGELVGGSSMAIDPRDVRDRAEALGWVASARVRLEAPQTLRLDVREQLPVVVWRRGEVLSVLAPDGAQIDQIATRAEYPDLPLIAGIGADRAVYEALKLTELSDHLAPRLRGLVRIGERRWNAVFQDGPTVMLPSDDALNAFAYFVSLDGNEQVLDLDVTLVDLRVDKRRTLRLGPDAREGLAARRKPKVPGEDA